MKVVTRNRGIPGVLWLTMTYSAFGGKYTPPCLTMFHVK